VIVNANQKHVASDFWMRAIPQTNCSKVTNVDDIKGVFHYSDGSDVAETPSTSPFNYTDSCDDELMSNLVPILKVDASPATYTDDELANVSVNANGIYQWFMGPTTFKSEWANPTLLQISENNTNWSASEHVIQVDGVNEWVVVAIEAATGAPHPVHLHVSMSQSSLVIMLIKLEKYRAMTL
jgi:Multicopper oxidase